MYTQMGLAMGLALDHPTSPTDPTIPVFPLPVLPGPRNQILHDPLLTWVILYVHWVFAYHDER